MSYRLWRVLCEYWRISAAKTTPDVQYLTVLTPCLDTTGYKHHRHTFNHWWYLRDLPIAAAGIA